MFSQNDGDLHQLQKLYPACKLTFFEIPPYSIIDFNKSRKHSDPKAFKKDEEDILANIIKVNEHIRLINTSLNTFSPIFGDKDGHCPSDLSLYSSSCLTTEIHALSIDHF
jgi:hypothetical protein